MNNGRFWAVSQPFIWWVFVSVFKKNTIYKVTTLKVVEVFCLFLSVNIFRWGFPHSSVGKGSTCNAGDPASIPGSGRSDGEGIGYPLQHSWVSLVTQLVKNLPAMQKIWVDLWVGKIPWRRERLPTPVFRPGVFHGLYSPWGHKESDATEWLSLHFTIFFQ